MVIKLGYTYYLNQINKYEKITLQPADSIACVRATRKHKQKTNIFATKR